MQIDIRHRGDICILDVTGELSFGKPTELLRRRSRELVEAGERYFILNLAGSPWLDSSGIGEVVASHKRAREKKGVVKLVLNERSRSLFTMTQLNRMFEIFDDLETALASFDEPGGRYRERF